MLTLGIETSTRVLGVALVDGEKVVGEFTTNNRLTHSQRLMPLIDTLLRETGASLKDLSLVAVTSGPGSFTGLRIGLTTAKAIAYALGIGAIGVPSLDVRARSAVDGRAELVCPVLDARRGQVYAALYRAEGGTLNRLTGYLAIEPEGLLGELRRFAPESILFCGDLREYFSARVQNSLWAEKTRDFPRASVTAVLGYERFLAGEDSDPVTLVPQYIRRSEAEEKLKGE